MLAMQYIKVCMVVVHQLVHTIDNTVACMMITYVMMMEFPPHWWVGLNYYIVTVSCDSITPLDTIIMTKTANVTIVKNDID